MSTAEEKNTTTETQEQSNDQGYWKLPKQMSEEYYEQHKEEYTFQPALESKQYYEKHKNSKPKKKLYENQQSQMVIPKPKPKMSTKAYYEKSKTAPRNLRYERDIQRIKERMRKRQELIDRYNQPRKDIAFDYVKKNSQNLSESTEIGFE